MPGYEKHAKTAIYGIDSVTDVAFHAGVVFLDLVAYPVS